MDMTPYIQAKSDQINADDLISGDITVQLVKVRKGNDEQPIAIDVSGGHCQWRPCKTSLRVLVAAWGPDASQWQGRWVRLYRDESVRFGRDAVGGIRIRALSHIDGPLSLSLAVTRGKKQQHRIAVIKPQDQQQQGAPTANLDALLDDAGLTRADVDRWREANNKPGLAALSPEQVAKLAGWLGGDPSRIEAIRVLVPTDDDADGGEE